MCRRLRLVGALVVALGAAGCASTPFERKEATTDSMVELRESMVETRGQIEKTLVSLNGLMTAPPDGLRQAYEEYAKDTDKIAKQAVVVEEESSRLQERSEDWLAGWKESTPKVQNPELKALSERRSAQALERIQNIDRSLAEARDALVPFVSNLQDVKEVVGNDLTPSGVAAVSGTAVVQNANRSGADAARALSVTIVDLQVLTQALVPVSESDR